MRRYLGTIAIDVTADDVLTGKEPTYQIVFSKHERGRRTTGYTGTITDEAELFDRLRKLIKEWRTEMLEDKQ